MKDNVLICHGGGPTAVLNASLYGAVMEAMRYDSIGDIYGAVGGTAAILSENFCNFRNDSAAELALLPTTPGTVLGSSRFPITDDQYEQVVSILKKRNIKYFLVNGGNGTMRVCSRMSKLLQGTDIRVMGIPKTVDNDLAITDHTPGYGSVARYVAASVRDIAVDLRSLPIHVLVVEVMGRDAGWIAASAALGRAFNGDMPHLIYVPELAFDEEKYLDDVARLWDAYGSVLVVASEGLRDAQGVGIVPPTAGLFGEIGSYLANIVHKKMHIKTAGMKLGMAQRASEALQSDTDRAEAMEMGRLAMRYAYQGQTGKMVGYERVSTDPYVLRPILIDADAVSAKTKLLPRDFINAQGNDVTQAFVDYARPLMGSAPLPSFAKPKDRRWGF
nr:diphosphate--fructose-6-phosphate 1-phosphotransferase [Maliibacterium massiliense]